MTNVILSLFLKRETYADSLMSKSHATVFLCVEDCIAEPSFHCTVVLYEKKNREDQEVDSQGNDQYFQDDDLQENNQREGEMLYLEYRPLQTDKEDNRTSANMDATEVIIFNFHLPLFMTFDVPIRKATRS